MASEQVVLNWVKAALDQKGVRYEIVDREDKTQFVRITYSLDCKLGQATIFIFCYDDYFNVEATIKQTADDKNLWYVMEYISRANDGPPIGRFKIDFDDFTIEYGTTFECKDRTGLSGDLLLSVVEGIVLYMLEKYGDGLLAVMFGYKTPAEAIEEARTQQ